MWVLELKQFDGQSKDELAMVDVAHAILEQTGEVTNYNDLLVQVAEYLELSDNELETEMIQFYTDLNIDGRFISLGTNRWGLRGWYPIDSIDEEITHDNDEEDEKPRRKDYQGFDDVDVEELEDEEEEDEEDGVDYGERVAVDEHGVMVDDEDEEDLGEYKEDLEDLGDEDEEDENIVGLTVVDDDDVLSDDEEEDE
ncbi:DNA-directed RNA polymerase subunit delta [Marinilactibacillus psychrotolerans]|uniref:DNA-directed RNA polymerase subunit delta n=1 Tax=Marinilactibacillus psychrotolerans TaxID=191770 RepID=UPI0038880EF5